MAKVMNEATRPVTVYLTETEITFVDQLVKESQEREARPLTSRSAALRRMVNREQLLKIMQRAAEIEDTDIDNLVGKVITVKVKDADRKV